jgi:hypothetical protein
MLVAARSPNVLVSCRRAISKDWLKSVSASSHLQPRGRRQTEKVGEQGHGLG